jgi:hypothetical protein
MRSKSEEKGLKAEAKFISRTIRYIAKQHVYMENVYI